MTLPVRSNGSNVDASYFNDIKTEIEGLPSLSETLINKTIDGDDNTITNLSHGAEVDNPTSGVHGAVGTIVGNTDSISLTNKTIDSDLNTITNIVNADIKAGAGIVESKLTLDFSTSGLDARLDSLEEPLVSAKSADYTITDIDGIYTIAVTTGATDKTITLPTAANNVGRVINITKADTGIGHVVITSSQNIRGLSADILAIHPNETITIQSDGSNWILLSDPIRTVRGEVSLASPPTISTNEGNWMSSISARVGVGESDVIIKTGIFQDRPKCFADGRQSFVITGNGLVIAQANAINSVGLELRQIVQNGAITSLYAGVNTCVTCIGKK